MILIYDKFLGANTLTGASKSLIVTTQVGTDIPTLEYIFLETNYLVFAGRAQKQVLANLQHLGFLQKQNILRFEQIRNFLG